MLSSHLIISLFSITIFCSSVRCLVSLSSLANTIRTNTVSKISTWRRVIKSVLHNKQIFDSVNFEENLDFATQKFCFLAWFLETEFFFSNNFSVYFTGRIDLSVVEQYCELIRNIYFFISNKVILNISTRLRLIICFRNDKWEQSVDLRQFCVTTDLKLAKDPSASLHSRWLIDLESSRSPRSCRLTLTSSASLFGRGLSLCLSW